VIVAKTVAATVEATISPCIHRRQQETPLTRLWKW